MLRVGALVVVAALALGGARAGAERSGGAATRPIVYGYPYTARCPGAGIAEVVDRWGMYSCNCTSYVAWALVANGQWIGWFVPGAMDARNWPHVARLAGLRTDGRPAVGSVVVWPKIARPFGHVAYVTGVRPDGTIDVAEYNLPGVDGFETFVFDVRSSVASAGATFIHVPLRTNVRRAAARPL